MVKVGFIVEGSTESIIISSKSFKTFLHNNGFELITPVIDANGGGNLLPKYSEIFVKRLQHAGAERVCILTDLENDESPEIVRQRIACEGVDISFIAVKAIESWFLADSEAIKQWLKVEEFNEPSPETTDGMPWDRLKEIAHQLSKPGPGNSKPGFAKRMVEHYHFEIKNAAQHPACPSATEMVNWFEANASTE